MAALDLPFDTLLLAILYLALSVTYLVVLPAGLYYYVNQRSLVASSIERVFMYFLVFFLFPGMLLLSPFLNLRHRRREV
jgi:NAD(P)H-quinone oxidoreductase subunit L